MTEWQPISTAPKDGTEIIVFRNDAGVFCAFFHEETECWFSADGLDDITDDMPTHWMPLPPPPQETSHE